MKLQLLETEDLERRDNIDSREVCFYLGDYDPVVRSGGVYSPMSSLVCNLKKSPNHRCVLFRNEAIEKVATFLSQCKTLTNFTIVPIPSSKIPSDLEYNPVLIDILESMTNKNGEFHYLELLKNTMSRQAAHLTLNRPAIDELTQLWIFDNQLMKMCKRYILLFDDVLTSGAHYSAAKKMLLQHMPEASIFGLFIARTV